MRKILLCLLLFPLTLSAQMWDKVATRSYRTDSTQLRELRVEMDAMAFFRDNEYDSQIVKGYTLPGVWLQPKLTYNPILPIHLELGLHGIIYQGASKYPNYAYHDIATWKGNQYISGAHLLPWFQARAAVRDLTLVLGNLYGAQNHRLIYPMFNPEQTLSTDPEMGFQLLLDKRFVHLDAWVNWQSFIYEMDSHQEAFTVGLSTDLRWNSPQRRVHWSTPIQLLIQHRGGEQDTTKLGVQTLCNASAGVRMDYTPHAGQALTHLRAEANALGSYQQSGALWPFKTGFAAHAAVGATLWDRLGLQLGYFHAPKHYANLFGTPFMSTLSIKRPGLQYDGMHTGYMDVNYTHTFSQAYQLGAQVEAFSAHTRGEDDFCFNFGVFMRVNPQILIKRW